MSLDSSRRSALVSLGAFAAGTAALAARPSRAATTAQIIPPGAQELADLMGRLRRAPRRRDFRTLPMILQHSDFWDNEALREIIAYRGTRKQVWDNTSLAGPWLNLMRARWPPDVSRSRQHERCEGNKAISTNTIEGCYSVFKRGNTALSLMFTVALHSASLMKRAFGTCWRCGHCCDPGSDVPDLARRLRMDSVRADQSEAG